MSLSKTVQFHRDPAQRQAPGADDAPRSALQQSLRGMDFASGAATLAPPSGAPVQFFGGIGGAVKGAAGAAAKAAKASGGGYSHLGGRQGIMAIQRALAKEGFDPGPADGMMGPNTKRAVREYQQANGLTVDGVIGAETLESLGLMPHGAPVTKKSGGEKKGHGGFLGKAIDAIGGAVGGAAGGAGQGQSGGERERHYGGGFLGKAMDAIHDAASQANGGAGGGQPAPSSGGEKKNHGGGFLGKAMDAIHDAASQANGGAGGGQPAPSSGGEKKQHGGGFLGKAMDAIHDAASQANGGAGGGQPAPSSGGEKKKHGGLFGGIFDAADEAARSFS